MADPIVVYVWRGATAWIAVSADPDIVVQGCSMAEAQSVYQEAYVLLMSDDEAVGAPAREEPLDIPPDAVEWHFVPGAP